MDIMIVGKKRKDGKYKVKTYFQGAPNMFGGRDHGQCFTSLYTPAEIFEMLKVCALGAVDNFDNFYQVEGKGDV